MAIIERAMPLSGGGLNFKVVGGTTEPTNPKENTIWINTDVEICEWQINEETPTTRMDGTELLVGDVWISSNTYASKLNFNMLKNKNGIKINIFKACQWDGSAWVNKSMKLYQDGNWKSSPYILYSAETGFNYMGAGNVGEWTSTAPSINDNQELYIALSSSTKYGMYNQFFDLTNYSKLYVKVNEICNSSDYWCNVGFYPGTYTAPRYSIGFGSVLAPGIYSIDLSECGAGHSFIWRGQYDAAATNFNGVKIAEMWFE